MLQRSAVAAVFFLYGAISAAAQPAPGKWWLSPAIQAELHLTAEQVSRIDAIFESQLPQRRALRQTLSDLERQLRAVIDAATVDDATAAALIEQVEAARTRRNVTRTVMLYRIRQVLAPEQRRWFDRRLERRQARP